MYIHATVGSTVGFTRPTRLAHLKPSSMYKIAIATCTGHYCTTYQTKLRVYLCVCVGPEAVRP